MTRLSTSVALCTFNGEKYLERQLRSIVEQTLIPDQLVIYDDGSTDNTPLIINSFLRLAPFRVDVYNSGQNLGVTAAFENCIRRCDGEIIALSDQDDCWHPEKLSILTEYLTNARIAAAFSDAELVDEVLQPLGRRLWDSYRFGRSDQQRFQRGRGYEVIIKHSVVTGATLAFRRSYIDLVLPIPNGHLHDNWISLLLSCVGSIVPVNQCLVFYRQHAQQQIGAGAGRESMKEQLTAAWKTSRDSYLREIRLLELAQVRLNKFADTYQPHEGVLETLKSKIEHRRVRVGLSANRLRRIPTVLKELRRYSRHSNGLRSVAKDLFLK